MLNLTLHVIEEYEVDVIDTGYLIPYGLIGYLASKITGIPFILRHGGSDIDKFLKKGVWSNLLHKAINEASVVITNPVNLNDLKSFSSHIKTLPPYIPNPTFCNRESIKTPVSQPILALIGKANYFWQHKGWHKVIEIIKILGSKYQYLFITQGVGVEKFKQYVEKEVEFDIQWQSFVHPFEMPSILNSINGIFLFEKDLPFITFSNLFIEAIYSDIKVITDRSGLLKFYLEQGINFNEMIEDNIIVIPFNSPQKSAKIIVEILTNEREDNPILKETNYKTYVIENKNILRTLTS